MAFHYKTLSEQLLLSEHKNSGSPPDPPLKGLHSVSLQEKNKSKCDTSVLVCCIHAELIFP